MKNLLLKISTMFVLATGLLFGTLPATPVYAEPETSETSEEQTEEGTPETDDPEETATDNIDVCQDQTGKLSWIICPSSGIVASMTDSLYKAIEDMLIVAPLSMASDSPIYLTWQYARNITNIVFAIFLIIVIYSQLTGLGLNNYGVKRILPRLIIAVLLVNLSFIICSVAVDASNIIGGSLRDFFTSIETQVISSTDISAALEDFSLSGFLATVLSGGAIAGVVISALGGAGYLFFMLLIVLFGALIAVVTGLITIAARQALVAVLIMISPLAFVAYLLPNTEKWYEKWKDLLVKMLIFYPIFSFLFGASHLIGYTLIASALTGDNPTFGVILGIAVQFFPLFFAWSLMKMSGTILGTLNSSLRRLASPLERSFGGWALTHAEENRQRHLANSTMPGAKLRRYLDYRRELRELDTRNSMGIRKGKAIESALKTASSSTGTDANGNLSWDSRANRYTINAKRASLYETRGATAMSAYKNTLGSYGSHFSGAAAKRLSAAHAEAYKDAMAQQYLTANQAEADQAFLLDEYLAAAANPDSYEYNRLIKSAAGDLGYKGEASIMGQVIVGNSNIENRRRAEARIMITKFGISKPDFRGMILDYDHINDDGIVTDADGNKIEDSERHLLPGKHYTKWQQYIGVHKTTGAEIDKDTYDNLSDAEKNNYRRVRYMDIYDKGTGQRVQRVFQDDAGYMKELLRDDVAIGDPINTRYASEIYARQMDDGTIKTGMLWKYHSTIAAALNDTRYKEHFAAMTAMLTSQTNNGFVVGQGEFNIAAIDSLIKAMKPGQLLQNDAPFIEKWAAMIAAAASGEDGDPNTPGSFSWFFPDEAIMNSLNVNGEPLKGMELTTDAEGNESWKELTRAEVKAIAETDPDRALKLRKNFLKHGMIPAMARKLVGSVARRMPPDVLGSQKPDTLVALSNLMQVLHDTGIDNVSADIPFEKRLDGKNFFDSKDPSLFLQIAQDAKKEIERRMNGGDDLTEEAPSPVRGRERRPGSSSVSDDTLRRFAEQLTRYIEHADSVAAARDTTSLIETLNEFLNDTATGIDTIISSVNDLVLNVLDDTDPRYAEIQGILTRYQYMTPPTTTDEAVSRKDALCQEIIDYLQSYGYDD